MKNLAILMLCGPMLLIPLAVGEDTLRAQEAAAYPADVPRVYFGFTTRYQERPGDEYGSLWLKKVTEGSPADEAGLKKGDLIQAFNGVPFRFENDVQSIRSLAWVEPEKTLSLTVRRGEATLEIDMVPVAADPARQKQLSDWLKNLELKGMACFQCQDEGPAASDIELSKRIAAVGGKAILLVESKPEGFRVSSEQVEIPEGFVLDQRFISEIEGMAKEKSLRFLVLVEPGKSEWIQEGVPGFEELD